MREAAERERDWEGDEKIWSLREIVCLRFFSLWTTLSRYGSRTHLTFAFTNVRLRFSWCGSLEKTTMDD